MSLAHIHLIEDEEDIAKLISYNLNLAGFQVSWSASAEAGYRFLKNQDVDLILLDLMLPGLDGLEFCAQIKREEDLAKIPVIMVSARGVEADIVKGLELGAEDYITKPFSPKVLTARVKALIRRLGTGSNEDSIVSIGTLQIHPGKHEVHSAGERIDLTHSEFKILHFLAKRVGWVYTRSQIVDAIHGENYRVTERTIDFQMVGLRRKLGAAGDYIETIRAVGYRFKEINADETT